jgi:glycosyltransferase involved in cell wall biosynthesis
VTAPAAATHGVTVLICTHNGAARLEPTLTHLAAQRVPPATPWEVVIVDNASTDDTAATASRLWPAAAPAPLRVITEPLLGLGHARRRGLEAARYGIVAFVDDDNWLAADWVAIAAAVMATHPDVAACGGFSEAVYEAAPPSWLAPFTPLLAVGPTATPAGDITDAPGLLWGAGLVLRLAAWQALVRGGFEPLLVGRTGRALTTGEDAELCLALRLAGWRLWFEPRLRLRHYMPASRLSWPYLRRLHRSNGMASVRHDPYYFAMREGARDRLARWRRRWAWQALAAVKEMARRPRAALALLTGGGRAGDAGVAQLDVLLGRARMLLVLRGAYDRTVQCVARAPWRKGAAGGVA